MRDMQRRKVYDWEEKELQTHNLSVPVEFKDIPDFSKAMLRAAGYKYRVPKFKDGRRCRKASYRPNSKTIVLPRWARTNVVIAHELAHYIVDKEVGLANAPWHGGYFMAAFLRLLVAAGFNNGDMRRSLWEAGIKFSPGIQMDRAA